MNRNIVAGITLALVAHDNRKEELADFVLEHRGELSHFHLVATGGTGSIVARRARLAVNLLDSGPAGGAQQLGALAEANRVQAVFFFRDPANAGPHEPDFVELLRVCDLQEIPLATNRATAEAILYFLLTSPNRGAILARPWGYESALELAQAL